MHSFVEDGDFICRHERSMRDEILGGPRTLMSVSKK